MAKQTFTAGQVLTATQMNNLQANDYNWTTSAQTASYVLVAANAGQTVTMTSASATTITVNTGLFAAGDRVNILNLGAGACTITAGTATVNSAGSLVLPQYGSGTLWFSSASAAIFIPDDRNAGLTLITAQTIGSAVSSVTVSNAFSATYNAYKIIIEGGAASTSNVLLCQLGATTTGYYYATTECTYAGVAGNNNGANVGNFRCGAGETGALVGEFDIFNPFAADETWAVGQYLVPRTTGSAVTHSAFLNNTTSYTAFTILTTTGTLTGGTIRVYGYQNS